MFHLHANNDKEKAPIRHNRVIPLLLAFSSNCMTL